MFFAILMGVFAVVFALIARGYEVKDYMEDGAVAVNPENELN